MSENNIPRSEFLEKIWKAFLLLIPLQIVGGAWALLSAKKESPEEEECFKAGKVADFALGSVTPFPGGRFFLCCSEDGDLIALSVRCTHLGCAVAWQPASKEFMCPCHSSVFDSKGRVVRSPAPKPLERFPVLIKNNQVFVDLSAPLKRS